MYRHLSCTYVKVFLVYPVNRAVWNIVALKCMLSSEICRVRIISWKIESRTVSRLKYHFNTNICIEGFGFCTSILKTLRRTWNFFSQIHCVCFLMERQTRHRDCPCRRGLVNGLASRLVTCDKNYTIDSMNRISLNCEEWIHIFIML